MLAPILDVLETFKVVPLEMAAVVVSALVLTAAWNVVAPLMVSCDGRCVPPITLANVGVPETVMVPSVVAKPLMVPVIVLLAPEKVAVAVAVLSSKVMAVTVTVFAKLPSDASKLSPPTILILVPVTVPLNKAEPALVVVPMVMVSAAILPEKVIMPGAPSALLITWMVVVPLSVILGEIVLALLALKSKVP